MSGSHTQDAHRTSFNTIILQYYKKDDFYKLLGNKNFLILPKSGFNTLQAI